MKRLTLEYIEKQIKSIGYELLSKKYINAHKKLDIRCNKGHKYKMSWMCFKRGQKCPKCLKNKQICNIKDLKNVCNKDLKKIQKYDRLKNELCAKNGIILIRIPYWEKNKEKLIMDCLYGQNK